MKHKLLLFGITSLLCVPAMAADVGVSISVGEPGFYGRLDIGGYPEPRYIYREPIVVTPAPGVRRPPMYLHVPPGHAKNWRRYCGRYDACGAPVYFVRDDWYRQVYVPRYRERGGYDRDRRGNYDRRDDRRDNDRRDYDRRDNDRRDDRRDDRGPPGPPDRRP